MASKITVKNGTIQKLMGKILSKIIKDKLHINKFDSQIIFFDMTESNDSDDILVNLNLAVSADKKELMASIWELINSH